MSASVVYTLKPTLTSNKTTLFIHYSSLSVHHKNGNHTGILYYLRSKVVFSVATVYDFVTG